MDEDDCYKIDPYDLDDDEIAKYIRTQQTDFIFRLMVEQGVEPSQGLVDSIFEALDYELDDACEHIWASIDPEDETIDHLLGPEAVWNRWVAFQKLVAEYKG